MSGWYFLVLTDIFMKEIYTHTHTHGEAIWPSRSEGLQDDVYHQWHSLTSQWSCWYSHKKTFSNFLPFLRKTWKFSLMFCIKFMQEPTRWNNLEHCLQDIVCSCQTFLCRIVWFYTPPNIVMSMSFWYLMQFRTICPELKHWHQTCGYWSPEALEG